MPYAQLAELRLYYDRQGSDDDRPCVLFAHNFTGTSELWAGQRAEFARRYQVIRVDLRGHGRSNNPSGSFDHALMADDLIGLIDQEITCPVHFVGSSSSAVIGFIAALRRPDLLRTLTAVGPPFQLQLLGRETMARMVAGWRQIPVGEFDEEWQRRHPAHGRTYFRDILIPAWEDMFDHPPHKLALTDLTAIRCPTLIAIGDDDPFISIDLALAMRRAIPGAELLVLPRGGHLPCRTVPSLFNGALLDFLGRHESPA